MEVQAGHMGPSLLGTVLPRSSQWNLCTVCSVSPSSYITKVLCVYTEMHMLLHIYGKYRLPLIVVIRGGPVAQGHRDPRVTNAEQGSGGNPGEVPGAAAHGSTHPDARVQMFEDADLICIVDL